MGEIALSVLILVAVLVVLLSGIPIWAGLTSVSLFFIVIFCPEVLGTMPYTLYGSVDNFALLALPLFIFLSVPISESQASKDLYEAIHRWLHRVPGGLGMTTMIACGIFAALCGSSPATAAAIGGIAIPEMRRRGYAPGLAAGLVAHAGTFGILIPPSIVMILYGIATETSIGKCFIAGVIPGVIMVLLSCLWIGGVFYYRTKVRSSDKASFYAYNKTVDHVKEKEYSLRDKLIYLPKVFPFILIIIGIMGTLYGGWATPSEAAAVGVLLSFTFVIVIYRVYKLEQLQRMFLKALDESTMILLILAGAILFSFVCTNLDVTQALTDLFLGLSSKKWTIIILINILLIVFGFFIPPAAIILMIVPLLLPTVKTLGFDPIWFAVIATVNMEIGLVTPPVGLNLYIVKAIAPDVPLIDVLKGTLPFVIIDLLVIILVCIFPELALWLPNKMIG